MKWVFFAQELLRPVRVAPGAVLELTDEQYKELASQAQDGFIFNVSPSPYLPIIWKMLPPRPESTCVLVPCGICMGWNPKTGWTCMKPMTKCPACGDTRTVIAARSVVSKTFEQAYAENLRRLVK